MFRYRASFIEPPQEGAPTPSVRITFPNGSAVTSSDIEKDEFLSNSLNRDVHLATPSSMEVQFEGYVPEEIDELENNGSIFTRNSPEGTFFDIGFVHIITTSTINYLRKLAPER